MTDRSALIEGLEAKFQPFTDELLSELHRQKFTFRQQNLAHRLHLDETLITRHALPYCITEETYFSLDDKDVRFFAAIILLHSLALTRIDDYYDGGDATKLIEPLNVHALAYSMSATHEALKSLLKLSTNNRELGRLLNVTEFVHSRMYKDYTERYDTSYLRNPSKRLETYLYSSKSRLLGSGYWEVMARASFAKRGKIFPGYLHKIDMNLRKYRQMIDELADIDEDLRGGLITLPILHILHAHSEPKELQQYILKIWSGSPTDMQAARFLEESNTKQWIYHQAMRLYDEAMKELDKKLGNEGNGYRTLFEYKRIKLESLLVK